MTWIVDISWLMTVFVGLLTLFLVRQYLKLRNFPPGPFPWPVVGNLLSFRNRTVDEVMQELRNKYGDIFTLWLGSLPFVIVSGLPEIKEGLMERRNDFAGRANLYTLQIYLDGNHGIGDTDYGRVWETLRKMGHAAIRKYTVSEQLPPLVDETTKETVGKLLKANEPFDSKQHLYLLISKIIASSIFGRSFQKDDDPDFLTFQKIAETFQTTLGSGSAVDFVPLLRPFYRGFVKKFKKAGRDAIALSEAKLNEHIASYEPGVIRDIIDSLLSAREEVRAEGKETASHMNKNLAYTIFDLYFASIETTTITLRWVLLYLATYPDIQSKVIQELCDNIGDRLPVQDDRKLCPYTSAVIEEVLRIRTVLPFGLPHKAICDSKIGGHRLQKGTQVLFCLEMMHNDPLHWENPEKFYPERFLADDGRSHTEVRMSQYMPFSQGRRSCIGEKLAIVQMFMVLAGIFRRCRFELKEPPEDLEPLNIAIFHMPKPHKIVAKPLYE